MVKNFPNFFRLLGTLTEIMTKKMVNFSKKIRGHFQDKTLEMVNSRTNSSTKKNSRHFQVFQDAWTPWKIQNQSVSASYLYKWLVQLNFEIFTAAMFNFFCEIPKYVQGQNNIISHLIAWPVWIPITQKWANLPSWLGMVKADWFGSMWSEIFSQMKFIIFPGCPTKWAVQLTSPTCTI